MPFDQETTSATVLDTLGGLLEHCFEAVVSVDRDGRIVFFNSAAERLFGYAAEEALGQPLELLIPERHRRHHPDYIEAFHRAPEGSRRMGGTGEIEAARRDGSEFVAEGTISKLGSGEATVFTAILRDVSERREAERRIRASEEKYRAILDNAPDAILVADAGSGVIREANAAAGALFGCAPERLCGRHFEDLHPAEDRERYRRYFEEHLADGRLRVADAAIVRDDGTQTPVAITAQPASIADTPVLIGFFRDIRHRKRHEAELAAARDEAESANQAKGEFLASMTHELRTPLNGIIGFAEMIKGEQLGPVGTPAYREYAGHILSSGYYLRQTIEEILDFSRLESGKFQLHEDTFRPAGAVRECLHMVQYAAESGGLSLETEGLEALPRLYGDPHAFKQVMTNLLSNAIKFSRHGGRVVVRGARSADGGMEIAVADTGIGIPEAYRRRVFERFDQGENAMLAARKGTGIGLPLAKALVELHGGRLDLDSVEGEGTTVTAHFPPARVVSAA